MEDKRRTAIESKNLSLKEAEDILKEAEELTKILVTIVKKSKINL